MTFSDLLHDADFKPAQKPSDRWKNLWMVNDRVLLIDCRICGHTTVCEPFTIYEAHCRVYPSKDIAETRASIDMEAPSSAMTYLRAIPV